jgi:hypothetical protein
VANGFPVLIGMHKVDVFKTLAQFKIQYRISEEDGKYYTFSGKLDTQRVNLCITDGIVTCYSFY